MLKKRSLALFSLKRIITRSRSRINGLKEGDANTKFFHMQARHRKRRNFIAKLEFEGGVSTSHVDKVKLIDDFYENLLGTSINREHSIDLQALVLPSHNLANLDSPFSEKEIWEKIKQMPSDKAPGLDGLTGGFYKSRWNIINLDVMAAMSAFWSRKFSNFEKLNNAFVTLISKTVGAEHVKDFRQISLVHSFAKLVTKVLANQLAGRLNELVSLVQSAFYKGSIYPG
jgi:hypothetical protein